MTTPEEAREAIRRLRREPGLYRAMVENGFERATEFTVDRVLSQWSELLYLRIPAAARTQPAVAINALPPALRNSARVLQRIIQGRLSR